jgi:hypothetical protein
VCACVCKLLARTFGDIVLGGREELGQRDHGNEQRGRGQRCADERPEPCAKQGKSRDAGKRTTTGRPTQAGWHAADVKQRGDCAEGQEKAT